MSFNATLVGEMIKNLDDLLPCMFGSVESGLGDSLPEGIRPETLITTSKKEECAYFAFIDLLMEYISRKTGSNFRLDICKSFDDPRISRFTNEINSFPDMTLYWRIKPQFTRFLDNCTGDYSSRIRCRLCIYDSNLKSEKE